MAEMEAITTSDDAKEHLWSNARKKGGGGGGMRYRGRKEERGERS